MLNSIKVICAISLLSPSIMTKSAEELSLPPPTEIVETHSSSVPARGMSMQSVEAEFGAPLSRRGPVGEPPIRVWSYTGFRVYFETGRVLHSVRDSDLSVHGLTAPPAPEAARTPQS